MNTIHNIKNSLLIAGLVPMFFAFSKAGEREGSQTPCAWEAAPGNQGWLIQHKNRTVAIKSADKLDLLFLGDSITRMWTQNGKNVFAQKYANLRALPVGVDGSDTSNLLWLIENTPLVNAQPRLIVLTIGINNLISENQDTPDHIAMGIAANVAKLRKALPESKIMLMGVFPADKIAGTAHRRNIQAVNAIIAKLDDGQLVRFMDIGGKFLDKNGNLNADISYDELHLTEKGYEIWADAIQPVINEMLSVQKSGSAL